jgi:hypothetical protein
MPFIEKIQKLPDAKKMKIIWTIAGVVVILMIIVWVISAKYKKNIQKDTTLFKSIKQGIRDVKENYKK